MMNLKLLPIAVFLILFTPQVGQAQTRFSVTDLLAQCPAGTQDAGAKAINSHGDVVGTAQVPDGSGGHVGQVLVWRNGVASSVPSVGTVVGGGGGQGLGITDSGMVAACSIGQDQGWQYFISNQGAVTNLADLWFVQFKPCGASDVVVGATTGQVQYTDADGVHSVTTVRVGIWENGVTGDIGPTDANAFGAQGAAGGISDSGQFICGWGQTYWDDLGWHPQAMLMTRDGTATYLGGLGLPWGWANDVNNAGHVVGESYVDANTYQAFIWRDGAMVQLVPPSWECSWALAINNKDQVVGYGYDETGRKVPFLWENDVLHDLNALVDANALAYPFSFEIPYDINDAGQIVISGIGPAGTQPYLLTPIPPAVPGDFNGDGKVTGQDFLIWQRHFPTSSGATKADGDANGDGKVTGLDFLIWQRNYRPG